MKTYAQPGPLLRTEGCAVWLWAPVSYLLKVCVYSNAACLHRLTGPSPTCRAQQKDTLTLRVQPWTVCGWEDLPSPEAPWVGSSEAPSQRRVDMEPMDTTPWGSCPVLLPQGGSDNRPV